MVQIGKCEYLYNETKAGDNICGQPCDEWDSEKGWMCPKHNGRGATDGSSDLEYGPPTFLNRADRRKSMRKNRKK